MRCGYLPTQPEGFGQAWQPPTESGLTATTCIGYTGKLPEVVETSRAWMHWTKGELASYTGGKRPSRELLLAIETLEQAIESANAWAADHPEKKGGA